MWPLYPSYLHVALMLGSEHEWVVGGLEGFGHKGGWPDKSCTIYGHLHGPFVTRLVHLDTQNGHFAAATKDIITVFTHKLTPSSSFPLEKQAPKNPTKPTWSVHCRSSKPASCVLPQVFSTCPVVSLFSFFQVGYISKRRTWPSHLHPLCFTSSIILLLVVRSEISLLVTPCSPRILRIHPRHLPSKPRSLLSIFFIHHIHELL